MMTEFSGGGGPADVSGAGSSGAELGANPIRRAAGGGGQGRAKAAREGRRTAQFAKFKLTELNLVPLVDTFVSIVFFALTSATVGELAPVLPGVNLPSSRVGSAALQELTLGVGAPGITVGGSRVMSYAEAASARSNVEGQPLVIPKLYVALKSHADSLRKAGNIAANESVTEKLAVQGDRTMRYDVLSRIVQTARWAGFRNVSLQVNRTGNPSNDTPAPAQKSS
jgi:biopolymer transport protein ExbD